MEPIFLAGGVEPLSTRRNPSGLITSFLSLIRTYLYS